ncbi:hypothetical protein M3Y95_01028300 [Aphelenchoides besseyi]|nr:hypothetical protein M3Y95_01028300 [Aphelenchoides besseyi]
MFRFLGSVILLMLSVGLDSYGNNECITREGLVYGFGYKFQDCFGPAEISIKWYTERILLFAVTTDSLDTQTFTLVINDVCTFAFEGRSNIESEYAMWTTPDKEYARCRSFIDCTFKIEKRNFDGFIYRGDESNVINAVEGQTVYALCGGMINELPNGWIWTKIRVEGLPRSLKLQVFPMYGDENEILEYFPADLTEPTTEMPTTIEESSSVVEPSDNSALSTKLGGLIEVLVAFMIVVL